jgi:hypothetical protein
MDTIKICPKCGRQLLAKEDNKILCLNPSCNWAIKEQELGNLGKDLPSVKELKKLWES